MTTHTTPRVRPGSKHQQVWRSGLRAKTDLRLRTGDFAVVGDVHGCWYTLRNLVDTLGGDNGTPPKGLTLVSVGDLHDKGGIIGTESADPTTSGAVNVLRWAIRLTASGSLITVDSNHGRHLARRIAAGPGQQARHGSTEITYQDLLAQPDAPTLLGQVSRYLHDAPPFVRLTAGPTGELVVAHAAVAERLLEADILRRPEYDYFLYTDDEFRWTGPQTVVTGHVHVPTPTRLTQASIDGRPVGSVLRIDTGVDKAGGLTAYLPHEDRFVTVPTDPRDLR
jgi:hypothetical protein